MSRTSLSFDKDVEDQIRQLAAKERKSIRRIVNDLLRQALSNKTNQRQPKKKFRVRASKLGFLPGIDSAKLNQLSDDLQVEEYVHEPRQEYKKK